jgi:hypothetical protein
VATATCEVRGAVEAAAIIEVRPAAVAAAADPVAAAYLAVSARSAAAASPQAVAAPAAARRAAAVTLAANAEADPKALNARLRVRAQSGAVADDAIMQVQNEIGRHGDCVRADRVYKPPERPSSVAAERPNSCELQRRWCCEKQPFTECARSRKGPRARHQTAD